MIINITDVRVRDNCSRKTLKIKEHPYYMALKYDSKDIYDEYIKKHYVQAKKKSAKWSEFKKICSNIKKNGFDKRKEPIKVEDNICTHGRHRMCMFRYIYGHKLDLLIKDTHVKKLL